MSKNENLIWKMFFLLLLASFICCHVSLILGINKRPRCFSVALHFSHFLEIVSLSTNLFPSICFPLSISFSLCLYLLLPLPSSLFIAVSISLSLIRSHIYDIFISLSPLTFYISLPPLPLSLSLSLFLSPPSPLSSLSKFSRPVFHPSFSLCLSLLPTLFMSLTKS